jgi:hypothetical protein
LGLLADTNHFIRAVAVSAQGDTVISPAVAFYTGKFPHDLPAFTILTSNNPTPGYTMLGMTSATSMESYYAMIIDNKGTIRWYQRFPRPVLDFQKQSDGTYTVHSSEDGPTGTFFELDNLGTIRRQFGATTTTRTDAHELRLYGNNYLLAGLDTRTVDLSGSGGSQDAKVTGQVVEYHRDGEPPLYWETFNNISIDDAMPDISLTGEEVNPWHLNAIDLDTDGNLLISLRNCDQVVKVDSHTGEIIWRLGGKRNQFQFINDEFNGFSHQHGIRRLPNGNIILFDNGNLHPVQVSRAVEYRLDEVARRAELVWEYRSTPPLYGFAMGFAQRLANGNTIVSYGTTPRVIETDMLGTKRWDMRIDTPECLSYRAFRIESLY